MARKPDDKPEDVLKLDNREVVDKTPFPDPKLYFKVFDSERDEPDSKYREDVLKLYQRWEEKYGRKWPENGLNTEDLVWLYEEAYRDEAQTQDSAAGPSGSSGAARPRTYPREKEAYPGEFIPNTEDETYAALEGLPEDPAARRKAIMDAKAKVADAAWVTDEFESEDYEKGNLEVTHGMYLWDRAGKPTYMPEEAPKEELGEGSEEWDDFYGSVRPRAVATEDVRDALWATDEFESDEDNTESEWEPEYVGAGLGLRAEDPLNPQWSLRHSNHPLAPFPGEPLKWASYVYDDGTTYEGLTRDAMPHGMGVMLFGHGTGGGFHFRDVRLGDKYEGEFQGGYAHGLGQLTSPNTGEVYIGEFFAGQKHGCGIKIDMLPFYWLLERGLEPAEAFQRTHEKIMRNIEFRTWYRNQPLGENNEDETVLWTVREDLGNPWDVLIANARHERKLRDWAGLTSEQKAVAKMVDILDSIHSPYDAMDKYRGSGNNIRPRLPGLDNDRASGDDSFDSIELQVGRDSEGGFGFGWHDVTDEGLNPLPDKLAQQIAADVAADRSEESEDREAVLGDDILNPTTGLSLRDYLDGRERQHNELLFRQLGSRGEALEEVTYIDEPPTRPSARLGALQEARLVENLRAYERLFADEAPSRYAEKDPWAEDTDTRFETESDQMELCDLAEILGTVDEAQEIVTRARMWRWKPYGEVTIRYAQDGRGQPIDLMQDPLHYPHGTKFMAPGPLGQTHPLPEDKAIRLEMARAAQNYAHIYSLYNFDWDPEPGSVQHKIDQRIRRAQELQMRRLERMAGVLGDIEAAEAAAAAAGASSSGVQPAAELASAEQQPSSSSGGFGRAPPVPFASMSMSLGMGLGKASRAVLGTLSRAAKRAPVRRSLARPQRKQAAATSSSSSQQQRRQG